MIILKPLVKFKAHDGRLCYKMLHPVEKHVWFNILTTMETQGYEYLGNGVFVPFEA